MSDENRIPESETLHEAILDSLKKGGEWAQEKLVPWTKKFIKLIVNEAKWIGNKSKESAKKIKESETYARIKESTERLSQSETVHRTKSALSTTKNRCGKKIWWYIGGAAIIICLAVFLFGSGDSDTGSSGHGSSSKDYRWIKGTWELTDRGVTVLYQFEPHGNDYGYYSLGSNITRNIEIGNYEISNNKIKLWDAETQTTSSALSIDGNRIRDVSGKYLYRR